jgi:hypothetical protein
MQNDEPPKEVNLEKIGVYIAAILGFTTLIFYIADIKERVRASEVKIEYIEKKHDH